ncbi:hypothetical protein, partial [Chlorobaculum sp. 24CR]|uniref:hypothetical protein n=1 Tax=Chlorobaculum sp. 24CR TaxID=2508878 RepID=UPI001ADD4CAA
MPEVCEGVEKEEESLQAEEVAFALTGVFACPSNFILLIFPCTCLIFANEDLSSRVPTCRGVAIHLCGEQR